MAKCCVNKWLVRNITEEKLKEKGRRSSSLIKTHNKYSKFFLGTIRTGRCYLRWACACASVSDLQLIVLGFSKSLNLGFQWELVRSGEGIIAWRQYGEKGNERSLGKSFDPVSWWAIVLEHLTRHGRTDWMTDGRTEVNTGRRIDRQFLIARYTVWLCVDWRTSQWTTNIRQRTIQIIRKVGSCSFEVYPE